MMSGLITDYLSQGPASSRPAVPDAAAGTLSFHFAADTETLSFYDWNDGAWQAVTAGGGGGGGGTATLGDGDYGDIVVSGSGTAMTLDPLAAPQLQGLNLGHASDTTLIRVSAGNLSVAGNILYRAGGTDIPVADGGTGASSAAAARTNLGLAIGTDVQAYSANLAALASVGGLAQGTHTIPVLAGALTARTTNGPASGLTESATNKVMTRTLDFDAATAEYAQVMIPMPKSWDRGSVTVQFVWTAGATGNVVWAAQGLALGDDDALDAAFGAAVTVTDGVTAVGDMMESAFTSSINIAGSPAAEDLVCFQFYRDAANGADTCAADASLIAVRIKYAINAGTDA